MKHSEIAKLAAGFEVIAATILSPPPPKAVQPQVRRQAPVVHISVVGTRPDGAPPDQDTPGSACMANRAAGPGGLSIRGTGSSGMEGLSIRGSVASGVEGLSIRGAGSSGMEGLSIRGSVASGVEGLSIRGAASSGGGLSIRRAPATADAEPWPAAQIGPCCDTPVLVLHSEAALATQSFFDVRTDPYDTGPRMPELIETHGPKIRGASSPAGLLASSPASSPLVHPSFYWTARDLGKGAGRSTTPVSPGGHLGDSHFFIYSPREGEMIGHFLEFPSAVQVSIPKQEGGETDRIFDLRRLRN